MVIFHSYVSLPEGISDHHWIHQRVPWHHYFSAIRPLQWVWFWHIVIHIYYISIYIIHIIYTCTYVIIHTYIYIYIQCFRYMLASPSPWVECLHPHWLTGFSQRPGGPSHFKATLETSPKSSPPCFLFPSWVKNFSSCETMWFRSTCLV